MFQTIDEKKSILDKKRLLPEYTLRSLREKLLLEWTYHSNAIEGNTLTLQETKVVLEGITVGGKTMREHLEAINHFEAIRYLEDIIESNDPLTQKQIRELHYFVLKQIDKRNVGIYRNEHVVISGAEHIPPEPYLIQEKTDQLLNWYENDTQQMHPIKIAAMLHAVFVGIHPFVDGNGRTARLLMNLELMKAGFLPTIIKVENRLDYYRALEKANIQSDFADFIKLVAKEVENTLDLYLTVLD